MGCVFGDGNTVVFFVGGGAFGVGQLLNVVEATDKLVAVVMHYGSSWWEFGVIALVYEAKGTGSAQVASSGYVHRVSCAEAVIRAL